MKKDVYLLKMDGNYSFLEERVLEVLKRWINSTISQKLWERYVDIHIDEIDKVFENRTEWINGSLYLNRILFSIIDNSNYEILLVIPLSCVNVTLASEIESFESIEDKLGQTPPSFFLYPKGLESFESTIRASQFLRSFSKSNNLRIYFHETKDEDEINKILLIKNDFSDPDILDNQ